MRLAFSALLVALAVVACGGSARTEAPAPTVTAAPVGTAAVLENGYPVLGAYTGLAHTIVDPAFEPLPGATAHFGELEGAGYRIEIPDGWDRGPLVLWAHGFRGFETELTPAAPPEPLRERFIESGVAWAASSYSENGYAPGIGADDTLRLKRFFEDEFGPAGTTYIGGESMGGNVVALALEHFPGEFDGGLALCGALGGQTQIDYLVSWSRLAEYFAGEAAPVGPDAPPGALGRYLLQVLPTALGSADAPTEAGLQFLSAVRMLTGGPRPFFVEGFAEQYVANFGFMLVDPQFETLLAQAATNVDTVYAIEEGLGVSSEELNEGIYRQSADPAARDANAYPDKVPTSGDLSAPLLTLHTTGDLFVPVSQEIEFLEAATAAGDAELLVQRLVRAPGHCTLSEAEVTTAWEDLVAWVEDGVRPAGDDLRAPLEDAGMQFTNPLRPGDPGTP